MKNKLLPFSVTFIFIIIFIVLYKGLQDTNIYTPESKMNYEVPSSLVELFDTKQIVNTLEIFQSDKFYLLNIWSSWCVPCRKEHPILMKLKNNNELRIIGINYKDTKNNAKNFLEKLGNPYEKIIFDKKGTNAIEWGAYGVPESYLISDNTVIKKYIGPLSQEIIDEIKYLIK